MLKPLSQLPESKRFSRAITTLSHELRNILLMSVLDETPKTTFQLQHEFLGAVSNPRRLPYQPSIKSHCETLAFLGMVTENVPENKSKERNPYSVGYNLTKDGLFVRNLAAHAIYTANVFGIPMRTALSFSKFSRGTNGENAATRVKMLLRLYVDPCDRDEIAEAAGVPNPNTVYHHLNPLINIGFVKSSRPFFAITEEGTRFTEELLFPVKISTDKMSPSKPIRNSVARYKDASLLSKESGYAWNMTL